MQIVIGKNAFIHDILSQYFQYIMFEYFGNNNMLVRLINANN